MLTLLTGAPGAGKTAAMVDLLVELGADRPLFVDGVDGLTLPHEALDVTQWHAVVPDGAIIAVDEAQRRWRPTGPGARVSPDVSELETHRHRGVDFFLTTQHPRLLHTNVRQLVGRHVHIRDLGVLGRWWYEWPEAVDPGTWRSAPIRRRYRLPRKVFQHYKSASMHIKPVRTFPPSLIIFGVAAVLLVAGTWYAGRMIMGRIAAGTSTVPPVAAPAGKPVQSAPGAPVLPASPGFPVPRAAVYDLTAFTPRVSSRPESAPAYDEVRKVAVMPRVVGAWCQGAECRCMTQQGTDAGLSSGDCRAWLERRPFNPYLPPERPPVLGEPGGPSKIAQDA